MKMMQKLLTALCLIGLTSSIALAADETVDLGPAKISMNLQGIGSYKIEKETPASLNYNYGGNTFTYQLFPLNIAANNTGNRILVEVHQISAAQSLDAPTSKLSNKTGLEHYVEISDMMPSGKDIRKQQYYVDGHKGIAMAINRSQKGPIYLAAYSPDLKDGSGKTIIILGSDFPLNTTKSIFESFKAQLIQTNTVSQNSMGQSNAGQSTTNMGNMGQAGTGQSSMVQSSIGQNNMGTGMSMMNMCMNMMQSMMGTGQGSMGQGSTM